jgi:hypothetical protein
MARDTTSVCVRFERASFGALHQLLADVDAAGRPQPGGITNQLAVFDTGAGPCELLVGAGTNP